MLYGGWGFVQQCYSLWKETILVPAGAGAQAPVSLVRWEKGEKSMVWVGVILDNRFGFV